MKELTEEEAKAFTGFHDSNRFVLPEPGLTSNHHPRHPAWNPSNGVKVNEDGSWHKGHTVKGYTGKFCHESYNLDYAHGDRDVDRKPPPKDKIDEMTDAEVPHSSVTVTTPAQHTDYSTALALCVATAAVSHTVMSGYRSPQGRRRRRPSLPPHCDQPPARAPAPGGRQSDSLHCP